MKRINRRDLLKAGGLGAAMLASTVRRAPAADNAAPDDERWSIAMNTSTIRPAGLEEKIRVTAEAGYDGIELWDGDLSKHQRDGRSLEDLGKRISDLGLEVVNIIGIWNAWPENDADKPKIAGRCRKQLQRAKAVGAKHIAAVPGPDRPNMPIPWAGKRYAELIDLGKEFGVTIAAEFLGFLRGVHTLGQIAGIAIEADRPEARIIPDAYHQYRGGSSFAGVRHIRGSLIASYHINDVPAQPPWDELKDSHRIYPGDGILPLEQLLKDLWSIGFRGPLSLEMFNRDEWKKDAAEVARVGIDKIRKVIDNSGVGA